MGKSHVPALAPGGLSGGSGQDLASQTAMLFQGLFWPCSLFPIFHLSRGLPSCRQPLCPKQGLLAGPSSLQPPFCLRLICTSLPITWVLQALCTSKPLVYTRNCQKFLPKDAASRQTPTVQLPALPGRATSPYRLGRCVGTSLNLTAPTASGVT